MFSKINRIFLILSITLIPTIVSARIGETKKECEKRYGIPVISKKGKDEYSYQKHNYLIFITFMDDIAISVMYAKVNSSDETIPLSQAEIKSLLAKNGNGKKWKKSILDPRVYEINKPYMQAIQEAEGLVILSAKAISKIESESEKERKKEKDLLDDL